MNNIDEFKLKRELDLTTKDFGSLRGLLVKQKDQIGVLIFWKKQILARIRKSANYYVLELYQRKESGEFFQRHLISTDSKELVLYLRRFKEVFLGLADNEEQLKAWRRVCVNGMKRSGERFMLALEDFGEKYNITLNKE